ncbi:acetyltransferase [Pseudoalteromonas sp. SMS1]|uniref:acetyltransferase n=1 Tax=Pseudoalteromonas sp. SMS1 TaxID=2908894 RepID=UPI001F43AC17|nr:acetyltransferase [Pseudoalteromonas sp. SMS1]MCF2859931.1 acetyltransferase [Pseudoalteromonas sp. SMS1]
MRNMLPNWICGAIGALWLVLNTVFWGLIILILGLLKWALRIKLLSSLLHRAYRKWCVGNRIGLQLGGVTLHVTMPNEVSVNGWYLLISNHISWLDIVVLSAQEVLPAPKFFLKDELKYVPLIGTGAWALDMPFMKRASKSAVAKNPKLKRMDVERTKQSCQNFRHHPTTVINFAEGTRFTQGKRHRQSSPYPNLLKPKAGGTAFALDVLSAQIDGLLNTVLVYHSAQKHICRAFMMGKLTAVSVEIEFTPLTQLPLGDYQLDKQYRIQFQAYMNQLWSEKSRRIAVIEEDYRSANYDYEEEAGQL